MTTIVCELSANHLGSLDRALMLVQAAATAGANAVKLQTFMPGQMVGAEHYVVPHGPWAGRRLIDLYREAWTPWEWHLPVFEHAHGLGLDAFSTPFSREAVDFLEKLDCPRYKIASFELVDLPLIRHAARTGKPLVISTGMGTAREVAEAVMNAKAAGCKDLTLLKCTSGYPANPMDANLKTMQDLRNRFSCKVGISDHTQGVGVAVAAAALGADMIEKHMTLRRSDGGPDGEFSMEPEEFAHMVTAVKAAREALGDVRYGPTPSEVTSLPLRRSLYFTNSLKAGGKIRWSDIKTARPALGLMPRDIDRIVGKQVRHAVMAGEPVKWEAIEWV